MSKMIKTTDTNIEVEISEILVVQIGTLSFEVDERYPWIDVYNIGGENKEFITQIDEEDMPIFVKHEELKTYCLNWYFDNVEIVTEEELERTAQEVPVQEQYETREALNEELNINVDVKCIDLNELKEIVDKIKDILKKECNCTCTLNVKINY